MAGRSKTLKSQRHLISIMVLCSWGVPKGGFKQRKVRLFNQGAIFVSTSFWVRAAPKSWSKYTTDYFKVGRCSLCLLADVLCLTYYQYHPVVWSFLAILILNRSSHICEKRLAYVDTDPGQLTLLNLPLPFTAKSWKKTSKTKGLFSLPALEEGQ